MPPAWPHPAKKSPLVPVHHTPSPSQWLLSLYLVQTSFLSSRVTKQLPMWSLNFEDFVHLRFNVCPGNNNLSAWYTTLFQFLDGARSFQLQRLCTNSPAEPLPSPAWFACLSGLVFVLIAPTLPALFLNDILTFAIIFKRVMNVCLYVLTTCLYMLLAECSMKTVTVLVWLLYPEVLE